MDCSSTSSNATGSPTPQRRHKFWQTQPVKQFEDKGNSTSLPESPIENPIALSEVKKEPYKLAKNFEWVTCDVDSEEMMTEVYNFLTNNFVEDDNNMFRSDYSREFLRRVLSPPGYFKTWHIALRVISSKTPISFISGVPARIRIRDDVVNMAEINFLCVHRKLRFKGLGPLMIKDLTRRVHSDNIWQAAYATGSCYPNSRSTSTQGFREMKFHDVPESIKAAYSLYNVSTKTPLAQLMKDALIMAKQKDYDVFNALDVMQNESVFEELKCRIGDGRLHYYLYNYRINCELKPSEIGLVLM
ncbi:Myristoyl-CoA:protein N-myristoyltransferase [Trema orientale]|uniref:Glycylpeptide N-tetradecanoyltransferase n=1 Tax=Trema orientale TaxID=63057 RepID=A0A2P5FEG0_TREOI|nr:Myristoyl-CoA:protein N-myristoyltransferase [Trema orientale]